MKKNNILFLILFGIIALSFLVFKKSFINENSPGSQIKVSQAGFEDTNSGHNYSQSTNKEDNLKKSMLSKKDSSKNTDYLKLHFDALLADTHNDFIWKVYEKGADFKNINTFTQSDLPRLRSGGVDVQVFAIWIPMSEVKRSYKYSIMQIEKLKEIADENSSELEFARTYDDIIRITNAKKICGLIGIEGGTAIGKNPDNINTFFNLGVRYIGLTWNNSNAIATSARDETEKGMEGGLTEFGIQVIRRMNETGMLIDVSHLGERAFWDVIETSTSPIIASHSDCYSINPHYRNLTDEQIKAIAKSEGYIGVNFHDAFLDKSGKVNGTTADKVIEHIDYIKNLVGADYVGIGADFDGGITPAVELFDASTYPEITKRLVEKNYSEEDIRKILGLNFLRVFKKVCG